MSLTIAITTTIHNDIIPQYYILFLSGKDGHGTKREFIHYIRTQVERFGNDGNILHNVEDYDDLTEGDLARLRSWGIYK